VENGSQLPYLYSHIPKTMLGQQKAYYALSEPEKMSRKYFFVLVLS